jgi:hypothetical protein
MIRFYHSFSYKIIASIEKGDVTMTITMELSDREVQFLKKMVNDMVSYEKISSIGKA